MLDLRDELGLVLAAVVERLERARANVALAASGIEPIADDVGLHGLRRTFASLRTAAGDDPVYVAGQLGHEDPTFTLKVYAEAVRHRERLTAPEREAFELALDWARMGSNASVELFGPTNGDGANGQDIPASFAITQVLPP